MLKSVYQIQKVVIIMKKDILNSPFIKDTADMISNMYRLGWDERNGGNVSCILDSDEVAEYIDINRYQRIFPFDFDAKEIAGKIFIVTGTGKYFRNAASSPETVLGIIKILENGRQAGLLWGFEDGGAPTSELASHLMSHIERLKKDSRHRVIFHTHPANVIAMTHIHPLAEKAFTKTLWRMITECALVFPDGVGLLDWMVCGRDEIGRATAEKMKDHHAVIWAYHGVFGTGNTLDEAFGLVETIEKAAEIYVKISGKAANPGISDKQLRELSDAYGLGLNI